MTVGETRNKGGGGGGGDGGNRNGRKNDRKNRAKGNDMRVGGREDRKIRVGSGRR